jgi:lysophospholipase L1-like esterase
MKIAFAGDSITAAGNWAAVIDFAEVENFAVSGDSTDALLAMIPKIAQSKPDIVSVLIGTNDFGNTLLNREGADVGARVLVIIEEFKKRLPDAKILLHTILPRGIEDSGVDLRNRVIEANDYLKLNKQSDIEFIDLWAHFVAPDGLSLADDYVMADEPILKLHLNENGYRNWITVLLPKLQRMVSAK